MSSLLTPALPSYLIGAVTVGGGLACFAAPERAYALFGLPLGPPQNPGSAVKNPSPSPYVYAMGVRQVSLGAMLLAFEAAGNDGAVAAMAAAVCLIGAVDGGIVWSCGGALRSKAWNHWNGSLMAAAWYGWRFWKL